MKANHYTFSIFMFLFTMPSLWSQEGRLPLPSNSLLLSPTPTPSIGLNTSLLSFPLHTAQPSTFPNLHQSMGVATQNKLPSAYCAADLAFFCRLEVQMEKATKIPVRFRLGDVQQVDYLEGKHEGWRYGH